MSDPGFRDRWCGPARSAACAAALGLCCSLLAIRPVRAAGDAKPPDEQRVAVGRCLSPNGTLLQRQAPDKDWQPGRAKAEVFSRDELLGLPGDRAEVESRNGAVRLILWGNLPELSAVPVLESAVGLHDTPKYDLDLTLKRGRVVLSSNKDKTPARIRVRMPGGTWEVTLVEKGDVVSLELYGRWPRGVAFSAKPQPQDQPIEELILLVLRGSADVKAGGEQFTMHAPPETAYFHWDSLGGQDPAPQRLEKRPEWAETGAHQSPEVKRTYEVLGRLWRRLRDEPVTKALANLRDAADQDTDKARAATTRDVVVYSFGALDNLDDLIGSLTDARHPAMRETAVDALRHWIGRGAGQDMRLYDFLVKEKKYTPTQAEIVVDLLHTPFQPDSPETYETLIAYLHSDLLPIRELARWHLYRLAPAGKDISFDAAASAEERERGYQKWKELIPSGKLPPKPPEK